MKKSVSLLAALLTLAACTNQSSYLVLPNQLNAPKKAFNIEVSETANDKYIESLQSFALDYYGVLDNKENHVFSPLSIATCYSMLYDGTDGKTKQELKNMLHYNDSFNHLHEIKNMLLKNAINDTKENTYLDIAQCIMMDGPNVVKQTYVDKLTDYYYAEIFKSIDKQLAADWVNGKTKDFLDVKPDDFNFNINTTVVLLNTIYAKAPWAIADLFKEKNNANRTFTTRDNTKSSVAFMIGSQEDTSYYLAETYRIASLPYKHDMYLNILLPNEGSDYDAVLKDQEALKSLVNYQNIGKNQYGTINWKLPKFKIQQKYDLMEVLRGLGLDETFSDTPNFANMVEPDLEGLLYIGSSRHDAGIEVSNEGVEAAAYTVIEIETKSAMPSKPVVFDVNHPFAYSLTTSEGYPLFMGVINSL